MIKIKWWEIRQNEWVRNKAGQQNMGKLVNQNKKWRRVQHIARIQEERRTKILI